MAKELGLSRATVSDALSGNARVAVHTRERVLEYAKSAGYRTNRDVSDMMSKIRTSQTNHVCKQVVVLDFGNYLGDPNRSSAYHDAIFSGISERAAQLNLDVNVVSVKEKGEDWQGINRQIGEHAAEGLILLPAIVPPVISEIEWPRYAAVYCDYLIESPMIDCVSPNHYRTMFQVIEQLSALGYQRIGLAYRRREDARLMHRWESAYEVCSRYSGVQCTEPLQLDDCNEELFMDWYQRVRPDVVVSQQAFVYDWLRNQGVGIPDQCGFCSLNVARCEFETAGIDLQPRFIGQRVVEMLVANLLADRRGIPAVHSAATVNSRWVDGPTVCKQR